jgi:hypothetical protein
MADVLSELRSSLEKRLRELEPCWGSEGGSARIERRGWARCAERADGGGGRRGRRPEGQVESRPGRGASPASRSNSRNGSNCISIAMHLLRGSRRPPAGLGWSPGRLRRGLGHSCLVPLLTSAAALKGRCGNRAAARQERGQALLPFGADHVLNLRPSVWGRTGGRGLNLTGDHRARWQLGHRVAHRARADALPIRR